jgi:hypothetical protein
VFLCGVDYSVTDYDLKLMYMVESNDTLQG